MVTSDPLTNCIYKSIYILYYWLGSVSYPLVLLTLKENWYASHKIILLVLFISRKKSKSCRNHVEDSPVKSLIFFTGHWKTTLGCHGVMLLKIL